MTEEERGGVGSRGKRLGLSALEKAAKVEPLLVKRKGGKDTISFFGEDQAGEKTPWCPAPRGGKKVFFSCQGGEKRRKTLPSPYKRKRKKKRGQSRSRPDLKPCHPNRKRGKKKKTGCISPEKMDTGRETPKP